MTDWQINEHREQNSGYAQGLFMKRHRVAKRGRNGEVRMSAAAGVTYSMPYIANFAGIRHTVRLRRLQGRSYL